MKTVDGNRTTIISRSRLSDRFCEFLRMCDRRCVLRTASGVCPPANLKPANIMVGPFGDVLVMDWGLAKSCAQKSFKLVGGARSDPQATVSRSRSKQTLPADATEISGGNGNGTVWGTPGLYCRRKQRRGDAWNIWTHRADKIYGSAHCCDSCLRPTQSFVPGGRASIRSMAAIFAQSRRPRVRRKRYPAFKKWVDVRDTWTRRDRSGGPPGRAILTAGRFYRRVPVSSDC